MKKFVVEGACRDNIVSSTSCYHTVNHRQLTVENKQRNKQSINHTDKQTDKQTTNQTANQPIKQTIKQSNKTI
jgi:hypothetical protein